MYLSSCCETLEPELELLLPLVELDGKVTEGIFLAAARHFQ